MLEAIHFQILEGFWVLKRHLFNYALGVGKMASSWRIIYTEQVRSSFIIPSTQACQSQRLELRVGIWGWGRGEMASDHTEVLARI